MHPLGICPPREKEYNSLPASGSRLDHSRGYERGWLMESGPGRLLRLRVTIPQIRYDIIRGTPSPLFPQKSRPVRHWEAGRCKIIRSTSNSPNNLRRVPCRGNTLSRKPERPCAHSPAPWATTPWDRHAESTLGDKEASISQVDGRPAWGREGRRDPWHAPLGRPSPLRAGSSCIRVCKYPDAHASRRRIEHELSRA